MVIWIFIYCKLVILVMILVGVFYLECLNLEMGILILSWFWSFSNSCMEFMEFKIFLLNKLVFILFEIFFLVKFCKIDSIVVLILFMIKICFLLLLWII